jgi:Ras-related protein Rab-1A
LVYDITDKQSFRDIDNWLTEVEKHAHENVNKLLVGNKCDLEQNRQVSYEEGKAYADQLGIKFLETSAKNSVNVENAFFAMANEIKARVQPDNQAVKKDAPGKKLGGGEDVSKKQSGGCC